MSLKGNLQSVDLANVLQMLSINQKEGTLVLFDGDTRKSIYFSRDGVSMLSRGRRGQDSLGRILLRYGRITPEQLQQALEKQKLENKRLGEALQEMGAAGPEDIDNAIRTQIEEEIYNLFIWKEASFEFIEGPPPPAMENVPTRVTFNVNSLIMEAQRRADEWNYIRNLIPSLDEIYRPTEKMAEASVTDDVFHFPFAPRVLDNIQPGRLNVNEIIDNSHAAKFEACKILAILLEQSAIEPVTIADLQAFAQEATSRGDHKQASKFLSRIVDLGGATPNVNVSLGYALEALDEPERASVYLKAAASSYVEAMEPKHAFDAFQRVARALPTDLPAVNEMVAIACGNPDLLAANRHEVVEAGRTLARCLKELGRLPAALQILHKLTLASPQDLPLRSMLVQAYQDSAMPAEAMGELEFIAAACAEQKNYDEAIRSLRKVAAIDRNRAGVMKKIEAYTRARDAGKRLVMRIVAAVAVVAFIGAVAWGFWFHQEGMNSVRREIEAKESQAISPHRKSFDDAEAAFQRSLQSIEGWKTTVVETLKEDAEGLKTALKGMNDALDAMEHEYGAIYDAYQGKGAISDSYVDANMKPWRRRRDEAKKQTAEQFDRIETGAKEAFVRQAEEAEKNPLSRIKDVEKTYALLTAVGASTQVLVGTKSQDVADFLKTLHGYQERIGREQKQADRLWEEKRYAESHGLLARFLGEFFPVEEFSKVLKFRVRVTTVPAKAVVQVMSGEGAGGAPVPAPHDLPYAAYDGLKFQVSAEGFETQSIEIAPVRGTFDERTLAEKLPWQSRVVLRKMPQWIAHLGPGGVDSPPVPTADGKGLVVTDRDGSVHLVAVDTGKVQSYDAKSPSGFMGGPAVGPGAAYVASVDGAVVALRIPGLVEIWRKEPSEGPGPVYGSPLLAGDLLVVAGSGGTVAAYESATGRPRWEVKLEVGTREPLLSARGWIVVTCEDGRVRVISRDGKEAVITVLPSNREETSYPPPRSRPLAVGDNVVLGLEGAGQEFSLVELPVPGAQSPHFGYLWGVREEGAEVSGATSSGDDVLLLFTNGTIRRVAVQKGPRPSDRPIRALHEKERPVGGPATGEGGAIFISAEKGLASLRPGQGEYVESWRWSAPEGVALTTPPLVAGKLVVVCARDGKMYALLGD